MTTDLYSKQHTHTTVKVVVCSQQFSEVYITQQLRQCYELFGGISATPTTLQHSVMKYLYISQLIRLQISVFYAERQMGDFFQINQTELLEGR
jgi:hypothetical protein